MKKNPELIPILKVSTSVATEVLIRSKLLLIGCLSCTN